MDNEKKIEIPFGAFDSELIHQEISIPNGFNATIEGDKIILTRAESEDEKIRKWLIGYFHQYKEDGMERYANGLKVDDILAWLEKQGKQEPINPELKESEDEEVRKEIITFISTTPKQRNRHPKWINWLEKQGEVESDNDDIEVEEKGIREAFNKIEDEKQGEQKSQRMISAEAKEAMYGKPAWTKEDDVRLKVCIDALQAESLMGKVDTVMTKWLESLKQRIGE